MVGAVEADGVPAVAVAVAVDTVAPIDAAEIGVP
jgi:hypothetical protein